MVSGSATTVPGTPVAATDAAGQQAQPLAARLAPAAGSRVQRTQTPLDHVGRLGEVQAAFAAGELAGVGDALARAAA